MTRMEKCLEWLKNLDMFGVKVDLLIKREETHKTQFGSFLSIGMLTLISILAFNQVQEMISRSSPQTLISEVYKSHPDYFELTKENFTISFGLEHENQTTYKDESIYIADVNLFYKHIAILPDGRESVVFDQTPVPVKTCDMDSIKQPEMKEYFKSYALKTRYCVDYDKMNHLVIEGTFDSFAYRFFQVDFLPCKNETRKDNQPVCASPELIEKELHRAYFSVQITTSNVNLRDPFNPHTIMGKDAFTTTSNQLYKQIDLYMKPITTKTDFGFITEDISEITTLKYNNYVERISLADKEEGGTFLRFIMRLDNTEIINYRSYIKIQDILSNLGGLWQIVFLVFLVISYPINSLSYKLQILNSLFNFEGAEEFADEEEDQLIQAPSLNRQLSCQQSQFKKSASKSNIQHISDTDRTGQGPSRLLKLMSEKKQLDKIQSDIENNIIVSDIKQRQIKTMKDISKEIKKFFQSTSKKLHLTCIDYFSFCCNQKGKNKAKSDQIQFSMSRVNKSIDILYIIKKLNEIDKLKMILLSKEQIKLFDYLPKPTIPIDPYRSLDQNEENYWSILKKEKGDFQSAIDAQKAYRYLIKQQKDIMNSKLIKMLDPNIQKLFSLDISLDNQRSSQQQNQMSLESDCHYREQEHDERFTENRLPAIFSSPGEMTDRFKNPISSRNEASLILKN